GLTTMARCVPRAAWMASTRSPSWFDCTCSTDRPCSPATFVNVATWSSSVAVPYTSGSRMPSRLRFGPLRSSTSAMGVHPRERGLDGGSIDAGDELEPVRPVEHERDAVDRLFVTGEQGDELGRVHAGRQRGGEVVAGDDGAVQRHAVVVDASECARQLGGEHETDGDRLAVTEVVAPRRLQRVRERVPVVQQGAAAGLALV